MKGQVHVKLVISSLTHWVLNLMSPRHKQLGFDFSTSAYSSPPWENIVSAPSEAFPHPATIVHREMTGGTLQPIKAPPQATSNIHRLSLPAPRYDSTIYLHCVPPQQEPTVFVRAPLGK